LHGHAAETNLWRLSGKRVFYYFKSDIMKKLAFLLAIVLSIGGTGTILAQKNTLKEERALEGFKKVNIGVAGDVYLRQGKTQKFEIEGDESTLTEIETTVSDGTLRVRFPNRFFQTRDTRVKIYLTMQDVEGISISGSARLNAETAISANEINLNISGSGRVNIPELKANVVNSKISGSGGIQLGGSSVITENNITISGSGKLDMSELSANKASVTISGSGNCRLHVNDYLHARISGSGSIYYSGKPQIEARVSGSGKVLTAK
jgi:hypothetical protein